MPSDERVELALEAVSRDRDAFRSAVAGAVDEVASLLEKRRSAATGGDPSLGRLAEGRIDAERFASLFEEPGALEPGAEEVVGRARDVLSAVHRSGDEAFVLRLEPGADLRDEVGAALARLGRTFGAARTVALARSGRWAAAEHGGYLEAFPPRMWNAEERAIAPPLVVRLEGCDLRPAGLSEYLDGEQAIVLVAEAEEAPPAPLVRLITPGVLVVQDEDPRALSVLEGHDGPAAAALFPEGSEKVARFVHDPGREGGISSRLSVSHAPDDEALRPVGSVTKSQQAEELGQLRALAAADEPTTPSGNGRPPGEASEPAPEPADRLAGWLLRQSGLDDLEG